MRKKKVLSIILIIAMISTNASATTFATSFSNFSNITKDNAEKKELQLKYFKEYKMETSLFLLNDENAANNSNENIANHSDVSTSNYSDENIANNSNINKTSNDNISNADISTDDNSVDHISNDDPSNDIISNDSENKSAPNETPISKNDLTAPTNFEGIASESDIDDMSNDDTANEAEAEPEMDESSNDDTANDSDTNKNSNDDISTNSDIDENSNDVAANEQESEIDENSNDDISTNSDIDETSNDNVTTEKESEQELDEDSNDNIATESEFDNISNDDIATESEIGNFSNDNVATNSDIDDLINNISTVSNIQSIETASISNILGSGILDIADIPIPTPSTADGELFGASTVYYYVSNATPRVLRLSASSISSSGAIQSGSFNSVFSGLTDVPWNSYKSSITSVVLEGSGSITPPGNSMAYWFNGLTSLTSITGLDKLNTSSVTDLNQTFYNCSSLTSLDLSSFNTQNVTNMNAVFQSCSNLANLNLSNFNTGRVTNMSYMFNGCRNLTKLDISSFNTGSLTSMSQMFRDCNNLATIYASSNFVTSSVAGFASNVFLNCNALAGDKGTTYSGAGYERNYQTYARLDGGSSSPGFFSKPLFWYLTDTTNTNDTLHILSNTSAAYNSATNKGSLIPLDTSTSQGWNNFKSSITKVVIDENITPLKNSMKHWFNGLSDITEITDINKIDTSNVTDMSYLFDTCRALTSLDLSSFNTSNVTNMSFMFSNCTNLNNVNLNYFNTSNVTTMEYMFNTCQNLTSLDLSSFNTSSVTNMNRMFISCQNLTTIHTSSNFVTTGLTSTYNYMFEYCNSLIGDNGTSYAVAHVNNATYAHLDGGTSNPGYFSKPPIYWYLTTTSSTNATLHLSSTITAQYNSATSKGSFTKFDNTTAQPWNAQKSNIRSVVIENNISPCNNNMEYWFAGLINMTTITDMDKLSVDDVKTMAYLFYNCRALTSLDLSTFDTTNVATMSYMFNNCQALTSITFGSNNFSNLTNADSMFANCNALTTINVSTNIRSIGTAALTSNNMFQNCTNLVGGAGYKYNSNHIDKNFARVDYGGVLPGYFTYNGTTPIDYTAINIPFPSNWIADTDSKKATTKIINFASASTMDLYDSDFSWNDGTNTYYGYYVNATDTVYVHMKNGIKLTAPSDFRAFENYTELTTIQNLNLINTQATTSMNNLFSGDTKLTNVDLSSFNTNSTTSMSNMFNNCEALTSITFPANFGQNATTFESMFENCNHLATLNLSNFNTSSATNMSSMFNNCVALTSITFPTNFGQVATTFEAMFENCNHLATLNLSNFNTSSAANMSNMFNNCVALTSITFPTNFGQVATTFEAMFASCSNITTLDLSEFITTQALNMSKMFKNMTGLQYLYIDTFNTANVSNMSEMFYGCSNLISIYVNTAGAFVTTSVVAGNDTDMFANCSSNLVGSKGTTWSSSNPTDKTYALIDDAPTNPGYFSSSNIYLALLNSDGGQFADGNATKQVHITLGDPTNTFETPTKTGYTFDEWKVDGSTITPTWTYTTNRTQEVIAHYATNSYIIRYDLNGGNGSFADQNIYYDDTFDLHTGEPTFAGYAFAGWKLDDTTTYEAGKTGLINLTSVNNDIITLTALWDGNEFDIVFDANTPTSLDPTATNVVEGTMAPQIIKTNTAFTLNENNFTLNGYTFIGWATNSYIPQDAENMRDNNSTLIIRDRDDTRTYIRDAGDDITYYALWTRNEYHINILQNEANDRVADPLIGSSSILFDTEYGTTNLFDGTSAIRPGYTFTNKWVSSRLSTPVDKKNYDTLGGSYVNGSTIMREANDLTYYPLWLNEEHTVTLDLNGGSLPTGFSQETFIAYVDEPYFTKGNANEPKNADGSIVDAVASDSETFIFDYWSEDEAGSNKIDENTKYLDSSITTIYANYKERQKFTISFDANGGTGTMESVDIIEGKDFAVPNASFTRSGYHTNTWEDQDSNKWDAGSIIRNVRKDFQLKALWTKDDDSGDGGTDGGSDDGGSGDGGTDGGSDDGGSGGNDGGNNGGNNGGSSGGKSGGGGGGGNDSVFSVNYKSIPVVNNTVNNAILMTDYLFITNDENVKIGIKVAKDSTLGKSLVENEVFNNMWAALPDDTRYVKLTNGFYKLQDNYNDHYYALDRNGTMLTGFVTTDNQKYYELDSNTGTIQEIQGQSGAKYYFYDSKDEFRGMLWSSPVDVNGMTYTFDEQGRVVKEEVTTVKELSIFDKNLSTTDGKFEYNPETNNWRFYKTGLDGNKVLATDGFYKINLGGQDNYYMFDENGDMVTGFVRYQGNTYYLQEYGTNRGAVYTGEIFIKGINYIFDEKGVLINAMDKKMSTPIVGRA